MNDGTFGLALAAILLFSAVLWSGNGPNVEKTDFTLTYVGAKLVHDGSNERLYDVALQKKTRDTLFREPSPLLFEHPPFEALLLSPLARLPFRAAYILWGFVNACVWLLLMVRLRPYLRWPREDLGYVALWFLFAPLGVALYQGQSSILLLAFYAASFLELKRGNDLLGGMFLGFGLLKFQFVLPFAAIFLFRKQWRFLLGFAVTGAALGLLSVMTVGSRGLADYIRFLLAIGTNPQNVSYGAGVDMPTMHGFIYALGGRTFSTAALNATVAAASLLLLWYVARKWKSFENEASQGLMCASAIAASLLTGFHMFTHDFSPLLLGMFFAASCVRQVTSPVARYTLISTNIVLWTFPVYFLCVAWHCLFLMCPILVGFTYGLSRAAHDISGTALEKPQYVMT